MKASNEELTKKYQGLIGDPFEVVRVDHVNHRPHPFMIGTAHVVDAADNHGGILGEATLNKIGCVWQDEKYGRRCGMMAKDHTSDRVCFLKVMRDCTNREAANVLFSVKQTCMEDGIDGFAFIKTDFNIAPPEGGPDGEDQTSH